MLKWSIFVISAIAAWFTSVVIKIAGTKFFGVDWFSIGGEVIGFLITIILVSLYHVAIEKAAQ
jgi:hypothetical protein